MVEFNVRETGNQLLKTLEDELGSKNSCRLTVDVLVPENLFGDKPGLSYSIVTICKYLDRNITHLIVDIELLRIGRYPGSIQLNIEVKGAKSAQSSLESPLKLRQDGIERLLSNLPYRTSYINGETSVRFSFEMTFQETGVRQSKKKLFEGKIILLAEDSEITALVFTAFLEEWGCTVLRVTNGQWAIDEAQCRQFDLIFIDIHMHGMPGNEVIRKIREFDPRVPIVAVATSSTKHASVAAKEVGADNFIIKPVDSSALQKILTQYFSAHRRWGL